MRAKLSRLLCAWAAVSLILILVVGPTTTQIRFANLLRPYAAGIVGKHGPIDVIFLGTSRVRSAIMAHELEPLLEARLERPVVIYDLGKSARGADADYLLLKETLRNSTVKLVVAEYSFAEQRTNHFFYIQAATWSDIWENAVSLDRPLSRTAQVIRTKLAFFMTELFAGRWFEPPNALTEAATFDFTTPRGPNWRRIETAMSDGRQPTAAPQLSGGRSSIQDIYLQKTVDMVRAQGGEVILSIIPGLNETAPSDAYRTQLERFFGVEVVSLTDYQLAEFTPHNYSDEKHHGWLAIDVFMQIVAEWLAPRLKEEPSISLAE